MLQNETLGLSQQCRMDWRRPAPSPYSVGYLMKLAGLSRRQAEKIIARHDGNREKINAELIERRHWTTPKERHSWTT